MELSIPVPVPELPNVIPAHPCYCHLRNGLSRAINIEEQSIIIQTIYSKKNIIKYISVLVMDFQKTAIGYDGIAMTTNHWSNDQLVFKQSFMS